MSKQSIQTQEERSLYIEQRMSKAFTVDPGGAGSASIAVQSPDAVDRNLTLGGAGDESAAVQSPDAADRNLAVAMASESASGGVQSPDAIERNLLQLDGSHLAPTYGDGDLSQ